MGETIQVLARKYMAWKYFRGGYAAQRRGNQRQAFTLYEKSLEFFPTGETFTLLGWTASVQGDLDASIRYCKQAIQLDPDNGAPYNDIGAYMIEIGELDAAIPWLVKAINAKRYDTNWFPWLNLGRIRERKGDWVGALECFKTSINCNPSYVPALKAINRIRGRLN